MNVKNNKRRQRSKELIEGAFLELLEKRDITRITVSDICKRTSLNRSTFYANYLDIYDLADKIRDHLASEVNALYSDDLPNNCGLDYLKLFQHIKENQILYRTYFKLGYDRTDVVDLSALRQDSALFPQKHLDYHVEFHKAGLNAIIKKWLNGGCKEAPEDMEAIVKREYLGRK